MKAKKIITLTLAILMAALTIVSASAGTLTDQNPSGDTEVRAHISGATPGDVTYEITIPDVVDFQELQQKDEYKLVDFTVELTKVSGLDQDTQHIAVSVRDKKASVNGNQEFWISNKNDDSKSFSYNVYDKPSDQVTDATVEINRGNMTSVAGYPFATFTTVGESVDGSLRLDQSQLLGYDLSDIVGDYSGYMVFYSTVVTD